MPRSWFEILMALLALAAVAACMFLPLGLIFGYQQLAEEAQQRKMEVTVGVAVILRAAVRRLLRSGSSAALRTTFGAFTRAAARTFTRRLVKIAARTVMAFVTKQVTQSFADDRRTERDEQNEDESPRYQSFAWAVGLGFIGLAASFWGVMQLNPRGAQMSAAVEAVSIVQEASAAQGAIADDVETRELDERAEEFAAEAAHPVAKIPDFASREANHAGLIWAALLAAAPLPIYAGIVWVACAWLGVKVGYRTSIDGLLLQGYFTGAGSFLPLTTDIEFEGERKRVTTVAVIALAAAYGLHLILTALGQAYGHELLEFTGAMFLVYCFVFSFPIPPLEGFYIWKTSKLLWLVVWIPILISFTYNLPAYVQAVL